MMIIVCREWEAPHSIRLFRAFLFSPRQVFLKNGSYFLRRKRRRRHGVCSLLRRVWNGKKGEEGNWLHSDFFLPNNEKRVAAGGQQQRMRHEKRYCSSSRRHTVGGFFLSSYIGGGFGAVGTPGCEKTEDVASFPPLSVGRWDGR